MEKMTQEEWDAYVAKCAGPDPRTFYAPLPVTRDYPPRLMRTRWPDGRFTDEKRPPCITAFVEDGVACVSLRDGDGFVAGAWLGHRKRGEAECDLLRSFRTDDLLHVGDPRVPEEWREPIGAALAAMREAWPDVGFVCSRSEWREKHDAYEARRFPEGDT